MDNGTFSSGSSSSYEASGPPVFGPRPHVPECDFCSKPGAVVYYTVTEYLVPTPLYDWSSGDRFYVCPSCRTYVDTKDWDGLIGYADLKALGTQVVRGFAKNYTPGAVAFTPGTNPESGR
ncbi:hypothetical protein ACIO3O_41715 [Streptomyces sp. NPDC087440]|uniref:hypothetical protein n=1 Tax=Streptomyces sp. NPDC087440 TaxID=3365790 RepID=UPI0038004552